MCKRYRFPTETKWYENTLEKMLEYDIAKILWDFSVQTNQKFKRHKPNTITDGKEAKECYIINVPCSSDTLAKEKKTRESGETPKIKERQIERLFQCRKVESVLIIIGAAGANIVDFRTWTGQVQTKSYCNFMQKNCLVRPAKIIRKALDTRVCM